MDIRKYSVNDIDNTQKNIMYEMYTRTYLENKQELWFSNTDRLFNKYPCFLTIGDKYTKFYVMYQLMKKYNKISLIAHDGSPEAKAELMNMLHELLSSGGYILEAAEKVSWALRKKNTPRFRELTDIEQALDIDINNPNADTIEINSEFKYGANDLGIQQHIRSHKDSKSGKIYRNADTLFGNPTISCDFNGDNTCTRTCNSNNGGKKRYSKKKKNKHANNKSKKYKKKMMKKKK